MIVGGLHRLAKYFGFSHLTLGGEQPCNSVCLVSPPLHAYSIMYGKRPRLYDDITRYVLSTVIWQEAAISCGWDRQDTMDRMEAYRQFEVYLLGMFSLQLRHVYF